MPTTLTNHPVPTPWFASPYPKWLTYWPMWLGLLSGVWLTASLSLRSPDEWLEQVLQRQTHVAQLDGRTGPVGKPSSGTNFSASSSAELDGHQIGTWISTWVQAGLAVGLPFVLLLMAAGYFLYWHFTRTTLFSSTFVGQFSFWLATLASWFLWKVSVTGGAQISRATAVAGIDQLLPTLTIGFWLSQVILMHVVIRRREDRQLIQEAHAAELAALTAQVNPPFIFHALRHLQTAAQTEGLPRAEQSLTQLAGIMQYVLEESRKEATDVSREIQFIRDYLRLQQLRLPPRDTIRINTDVVWDNKPASIVPLLLNPLIENAFKYGISMQQPCFVTIRLHITDGLLTFTSENSILPRTELEKGTGLGLANVRKRLQLAYSERHKFTVTTQPDRYRVDLKIKLI